MNKVENGLRLRLLQLILLSVFQLEASKIPDIFCGFPGAPANGVVNPDKGFYKVGENVAFKCDDGFKLDGPPKNSCKKEGEWQHPLPVCATNFAYKQYAFQSSTYHGFNASLAVDGNASTCSQTTNSENGSKHFWRVRLTKDYVISSVHVVTHGIGSGRYFSVSIGTVKPGTNQLISSCNTISVSEKNAIDETSICSQGNKEVRGSEIQIMNERNDQPLLLCEVEVTVTEVYQCGRPDVQPNCVVKISTEFKIPVAEYEAKSGYVMKGKKHRTCKDGKWNPAAPLCLTHNKTSTKAADDGPLDNKVNIATLIACAVSISTIFVMTLVFVIMRKSHQQQLLKYKQNSGRQTISNTNDIDKNSFYDTIDYSQFTHAKRNIVPEVDMDDYLVPRKFHRNVFAQGNINETFNPIVSAPLETEKRVIYTEILHDEWEAENYEDLKDNKGRFPLNEEAEKRPKYETIEEDSRVSDMETKHVYI